MLPIRSISIIGTGNAAFQIGRNLNRSGLLIAEVWGRDHQEALLLADELQAKVTNPEDFTGDLIFLCLSDDAIETSSLTLSVKIPVIHCSGSKPLSALKNSGSKGVFYPLQTMSKTREIDFSEVPILVEADSKELLESLKCLGTMISKKVFEVNSENRSHYHVSAVMVNNFINHLIYLSQEELRKNELDLSLLKPLILETIEKAFDLDPYQAQTGPARRGDKKVIEEHSTKLSGHTKEIYDAFSSSILSTYHDQL
jgi:predicted short-subunit dehydrogenase-like oxidoreductase (DUF2520 family)